MWSKKPLASNNWMLDVSLRITGRLKNGADGMVRAIVVFVLDDPFPNHSHYCTHVHTPSHPHRRYGSLSSVGRRGQCMGTANAGKDWP